jgi:tetratricopeptide (TPR) repeat protein
MNINLSANPPESPFRLFISYAHENEACKDRLRKHLAPLERNCIAKVWDDRAIPAGALWRNEIEAAMGRSDAAIFLLDENFIASDFCMDAEVPEFLKRHHETGTLIIFVVTDYCGWNDFPFINQHKVIPLDGRPITSYKPYSKAYTHIMNEIKGALALHRPKPLVVPPLVLTKRARMTDSSKFPSFITTGIESDSAETSIPVERDAGLDLLLAKLPSATTHLFGREAELEQINAWKDHKGIFLWVAEGGTGKSALVRWWLERQAWPAGTRFLGHSFYSQGSRNQATSSRSFLLEALKQLEVKHEESTADDELGRMLAEAVAATPTVLVLDGIEPLQQIADDNKLNGMVKDRGLAALLEKLARQPGQSLCLASSRLHIPESSIADAAFFIQRELGLLQPEGAMQLLRQRGVRGTDVEIESMAQRCGQHPLALVLAAEFCHTFLQDSAAEFLAREWQPQTGGKHAASIMALFDHALEEEQQALDRELALILGLFDRPAPWRALLALKQAAPIVGLTVALHEADEAVILESLARLSQWGLLNADLACNEPELDAHPLVREYFGGLLEQKQVEAWRAAHNVLFEWFCKLPAKWQPDTQEEMDPLYRAIGHGCKARRYLTALETVFMLRIHRSEEVYGLFQLGDYSSSLAALAGFFPNGWNQPPLAVNTVIPKESLGERACSWLQSSVSFCFAALGWLEEALMLREVDRSVWLDRGDHNNFCASNMNMTNLLALLGRWREAEFLSREALDAALNIEDKEKCWQRTVESYGCLGRTLHNQGCLSKALSAFKQAEAVLVNHSPSTPQLYSTDGYDYARLLLEHADKQKRLSEVLGRGRAALRIDKKQKNITSVALDYCVIGLANLARNKPDAAPALNQAVATMQRAGLLQRQPEMHLARATYLRAIRDFPAAWADHDAAYAIAYRGNMRTYLAECVLLAANLHLDEGHVAEAAAQYASVAQLIREDGYGRRYTELHLLHARLLHAQHDNNTMKVLAEAEARIREVGQWFFWRELCAVAKEIGASDPGKCPA